MRFPPFFERIPEEMESPCPNPATTIRRNPPRRARPTPSTTGKPSENLPEFPSFPINEIISMHVPPPEPVKPSIPESLKVYLRIRPLKSSVKSISTKPKNVWPQNPSKKNNTKENGVKKKKSNDVCITVNDSRSVTLCPPPAFLDSKRTKSEVYGGFSHVFSTDSAQTEVYDTMVSPIVEDFLKGKSGMLAALGPTGSGKTHTVFGSTREPGMVPLAIKHIFKQTHESSPGSSRSFYISIFEIHSERGKGERLCDLMQDGTDLYMQQSTIKGLQELLISDVERAESVVAGSMLKRSTAMTNSNSQSSRSQCIINIRSQSNNAVLTIVDLAGAEREKRTGNQGTRLLESNFINNTSMVLGLCLRSLLDRQKNPKKALEKHFLNSLLTRYLRDYLQGKKRMTLILTVKPGEEDFLDTSYLLKQASPYMKIKFDNAEAISNKRQHQTFPRVDHNKKTKLNGNDDSEIEGKSIRDRQQISEKECSKLSKVEKSGSELPKMDSDDSSKSNRSHMIMQNFAKALWSVLKQYNEKLKLAEGEVQKLKEDISNERTKSLELENELSNRKYCCICLKQNRAETSLAMIGTSNDARDKFEGHLSCADERHSEAHSPNVNEPQCSSTPERSRSIPEKGNNLIPEAQTNAVVQSIDQKSPKCFSTPESSKSRRKPKTCENLSGIKINIEDSRDSNHMRIKESNPNSDVLEFVVSSSFSSAMVRNDSCLPEELTQQPKKMDEGTADLELTSTIDVKTSQVCEPDTQPKHDPPRNIRNTDKPKRRLMPASSMLLRDINILDTENEIEKPKGNKGGKTLAVVAGDGRQRTQGSISLLHLLKSNLHL